MSAPNLSEKLQNAVFKILRFIFAIFMYVFAFLGATEIFGSGSIAQLLYFFLFAPMFFLFVVFIHEMGHAIAARALGYEVQLIAVGTFGFNPKRRKFEWIRNYSHNEIAGFVRYFAPMNLRTRWGENVVSFAGPLATIILGFSLLIAHIHFGERIEYIELPNNVSVPKILDWSGRILFEPSVGPRKEVYPHIGFQLLAVVCFLDAIFNLLPLKLGTVHKSDGRNILESFLRPKWTRKPWASAQVYHNLRYASEEVSDSEWEKIRQKYPDILEAQPDFASYFCFNAWIKTDPEAFVSAVDHMLVDNDIGSFGGKWQYVVCRILCNKYDDSLHDLMEKPVDEDASIYNFAKALLYHVSREHDDAIRVVEEARRIYLDKNGVVPAEEDAIFVAIENKLPFPELKWLTME